MGTGYTGRSGDANEEELLQKTPFEFVSWMEHELRGGISALEGWWSLLTSDDAEEYHAEARASIPDNIEDLIELADLIKRYKDIHRQRT